MACVSQRVFLPSLLWGGMPQMQPSCCFNRSSHAQAQCPCPCHCAPGKMQTRSCIMSCRYNTRRLAKEKRKSHRTIPARPVPMDCTNKILDLTKDSSRRALCFRHFKVNGFLDGCKLSKLALELLEDITNWPCMLQHTVSERMHDVSEGKGIDTGL